MFAVPSPVIAPALPSTRLSAVEVPVSSVALSSSITTAPAELKVRLPAAKASPAASPTLIEVPLNAALPPTVVFAVPSPVIAPALPSVRLPAVEIPVSSVALSS